MINETLFNSLGGTWVSIWYDGIQYVAVGYRAANEVELRGIDGSIMTMDDSQLIVEFDDNVEQAFCNDIELPRGFYFEHTGKTEYDLALDVGTYLASLGTY